MQNLLKKSENIKVRLKSMKNIKRKLQKIPNKYHEIPRKYQAKFYNKLRGNRKTDGTDNKVVGSA